MHRQLFVKQMLNAIILLTLIATSLAHSQEKPCFQRREIMLDRSSGVWKSNGIDRYRTYKSLEECKSHLESSIKFAEEVLDPSKHKPNTLYPEVYFWVHGGECEPCSDESGRDNSSSQMNDYPSKISASQSPPDRDPQRPSESRNPYPSSDQRISNFHQNNSIDGKKIGETVLRAAPGMIDAIDRYRNERSRRNKNGSELEGKPEGFHSYDKPSDEWVMESSENMTEIREKEFKDFLKNQPVKPGEDGYVTAVKPFGTNAMGELTGPKNYFVNGVANTYVDHRNSAQVIANSLGQPVNGVYSESALEVKSPESVLGIGKAVGEDIIDTPMMAEGGAGGASSAALSINVIEDLLAGEKVRVFAHSRGAANVYGSVLYAQKALNDMGKESLMKNLEVITLGGYSPPAREWSTNATVVNILNPGDAVPALRGQGGASGVLTSPYNAVVHTWHAHPVKSYLPWVEYIGQHGINDVVRGQATTLEPPPNKK